MPVRADMGSGVALLSTPMPLTLASNPVDSGAEPSSDGEAHSPVSERPHGDVDTWEGAAPSAAAPQVPAPWARPPGQTSDNPIDWAVAPKDVGPWTGATRRVLQSHDVRESFYRFGMVAPDAKLYWDVMSDFFHDVGVSGYRANRLQGVKRTFKFFTTPTSRLTKWIEELLADNPKALRTFQQDKVAFQRSMAKGRMLGAGFGFLLAVGSWNKACQTMDDPHSSKFERSLRWVDFATALGASIPELPQMRLLSFSLAILTAVFEAAFWHKKGIEDEGPEPNAAASTKMLAVLNERARAGLVSFDVVQEAGTKRKRATPRRASNHDAHDAASSPTHPTHPNHAAHPTHSAAPAASEALPLAPVSVALPASSSAFAPSSPTSRSPDSPGSTLVEVSTSSLLPPDAERADSARLEDPAPSTDHAPRVDLIPGSSTAETEPLTSANSEENEHPTP